MTENSLWTLHFFGPGKRLRCLLGGCAYSCSAVLAGSLAYLYPFSFFGSILLTAALVFWAVLGGVVGVVLLIFQWAIPQGQNAALWRSLWGYLLLYTIPSSLPQGIMPLRGDPPTQMTLHDALNARLRLDQCWWLNRSTATYMKLGTIEALMQGATVLASRDLKKARHDR